MYLRSVFFIIPIIVFLSSCEPKPLDIQLPQTPPQITLSSLVVDSSTIYVTVIHSINALKNLNSTSGGNIPGSIDEILVKNAQVLLLCNGRTDTLHQQVSGIYGSTSLKMRPFDVYTITVADPSNGQKVSAETTYMPGVSVTEILPKVNRTMSDTTVYLHLAVKDDPSRQDFYLLSYSNINPATVPSLPGGNLFPVLEITSNRKLELFSDEDAMGNLIIKDFELLPNSPDDTLYFHVGRVDRKYFEYLTAYKRTGSFFNQLTGEPITLPTNVLNGLGYFCLYEAHRDVFFLKDF